MSRKSQTVWILTDRVNIINRSSTLLPGEELVAEGRRDLAQGRETVASLLVSIGAPRLNRLGEPVASPWLDPEHRLYRLLAATDADAAHSRYNALIRRLVSYERARACGR